jgi:hypothetical protein
VGGKRRGWGVMTQSLYAHMNKGNFKKLYNKLVFIRLLESDVWIKMSSHRRQFVSSSSK